MEVDTIKAVSGAVEETAKLGQESVKVGRELGHFFSKFVTDPLHQVSGIISDRLKFHRTVNQIKFKAQIEELAAEYNLQPPSRDVSFKYLLPIVENASLENDDVLRKMWAKLLLNFGNRESGVEIRTSYIEILKGLTPLEVQILNTIYTFEFDYDHQPLSTEGLPVRVEVITKKDLPNEVPFVLKEEIEFALANLERIGCLSAQMTWGGGRTYSAIHPTVFGRSFVNACSL